MRSGFFIAFGVCLSTSASEVFAEFNECIDAEGDAMAVSLIQKKMSLELSSLDVRQPTAAQNSPGSAQPQPAAQSAPAATVAAAKPAAGGSTAQPAAATAAAPGVGAAQPKTADAAKPAAGGAPGANPNAQPNDKMTAQAVAPKSSTRTVPASAIPAAQPDAASSAAAGTTSRAAAAAATTTTASGTVAATTAVAAAAVTTSAASSQAAAPTNASGNTSAHATPATESMEGIVPVAMGNATSTNATETPANATEILPKDLLKWMLFPFDSSTWSNWKFKINKDDLRASWDSYIVSCTVTWAIWMLLGLLIYSCCFPETPEVFRDPEDPHTTFTSNHFGCLKRPKICLCAFFCPAIQWADSMHLAGILKVWIGMAVFFACALVNSLIVGGVAMMGCMTSLLIIIYRQRLREKLDLKAWTLSNCALDCLYVCCCPCCAISQEAQVVRYAHSRGVITAGVVRRDAPRIYTSQISSSNSLQAAPSISGMPNSNPSSLAYAGISSPRRQ